MFLLLAVSDQVLAQVIEREVLFDLSVEDPSIETTLTEAPLDTPVEMVVHITGALPHVDYRVGVNIERFIVPVIDLSAFDAARDDDAEGGMALDRDPCVSFLIHLRQQIFALEDETGLPGVLRDAQFQARGALLEGEVNEQCLVTLRDAFYGLTTHNAVRGGMFTFGRGDRLVVTVSRIGTDTVWTKIIPAPPGPRWNITYGFTFLEDGDRSYFTVPIAGEENMFTIMREDDSSTDLDFAPSVLFTWVPGSQTGKRHRLGFTAGLGFDFESPLVLLGVSFTIGENVNLFAGAALHEQDRLSGRFTNGQILRENLDNDTLTDGTFTASAVIGVGFRFNANPFNRGGNGDNGDDEESAPERSADN